MPPITDILFADGDSEFALQGGSQGGNSYLAQSVPAGAGVTFVSLSSIPSADITFILTAADFSTPPPPFAIEQYGLSGANGSISPSTFRGDTITQMKVQRSVPPLIGEGFTFSIGAAVAQDFFTTLTVNGSTFTSASATSFTPGATSTWYWQNQYPFTAAGGYNGSITL